MTNREARKLAMEASPCPFCGEGLTVWDGTNGSFVAHCSYAPDPFQTNFTPSDDDHDPCIAFRVKLTGEADLQKWNTRA